MEVFSSSPGAVFRSAPMDSAAPGGLNRYDSVQAGPLTRNTGMQRRQVTPAEDRDAPRQAADGSMAAAAGRGETG